MLLLSNFIAYILMVRKYFTYSLLCCYFLVHSIASYAQRDTLKVMAYNVLYYGNGCQGPDEAYHNYLNTILKFADPDIVSLEKMSSIPLNAEDKYGVSKFGFADSVLKYAFNTQSSNRYAYCPFTNYAKANNMSVLFYDQHKLGFCNIVSTYVNGTDYNTYKLYYKSKDLVANSDTVFLYVTCNHTKSGDEFEQVRELQVKGTLNSLKHHFKGLGNHLYLGDFNVRNSDEGFYQQLIADDDSSFRFLDPPFFPDRVFKYPANWDHEGKFAAYFTTSTRESSSVPNTCGSGGGGKNWYDHIFISPWLLRNEAQVQYIPHSYTTIGNDGQRYKVAINNKNVHVNNSAPADVIEALYRMSNKYPVMLSLTISSNQSAVKNAEVPYPLVVEKGEVSISHVTTKSFQIDFPAELGGQEIVVQCIDKNEKVVLSRKLILNSLEVNFKHDLSAGTYHLNVSGRHNLIADIIFTVDK